MRGRLFARNPAVWLLALFKLYRAPRPRRIETIGCVEWDGLTSDVEALSGLAEISGLP